MLTVKEEIKSLIDALPDDATLDDIIYHLYVRRKIETSIKGVSNGEFVSREDAIKQMREWQIKLTHPLTNEGINLYKREGRK